MGCAPPRSVTPSCTRTLTQQGKPPKLDENGKKKSTPPFESVNLPGIAATVSRKAADVLLGHIDIRVRLGCRLEECGTSVDGPTKDSRRHYLHARAHEMDALTRKPTAWRATAEANRLSRALALRELVNDKYRPQDTPALKTRALSSILDLSGGNFAAQTA